MARIRTIKPEFWTDEKIVELSAFARLLFIGLWNLVDDEGRLEFSPKRIKMQLFPADDLNISELFGEIRGKKLVTVYTIENKEYLQINSFSKHQKIDKRAASKIPCLPDPPRIPPTERKGKEGKGKEVYSDTIVSGDISPESDPKKFIFDNGVKLLMNGSSKEGTIRAFLGKQIKNFGESEVFSAVSDLLDMEEKPVDAKSYLVGMLSEQKPEYDLNEIFRKQKAEGI